MEWWTYDGISGPSFWGLINPEWSQCNQGLRQSPIDIQSSELLYDPGLQEFSLTPNTVSGRVTNTGHTVTFSVRSEDSHLVNVTGGSLSYSYQLTSLVLHWGEGHAGGSEHSVDGQHAALEVQLLGYNGQLYSHHSLATRSEGLLSFFYNVAANVCCRSPNGVLGIAILAKVKREPDSEMSKFLFLFPDWN